MIKLLGVSAAAIVVLSVPAYAQVRTIDTTDPEVVADAIREQGYKAVVGTRDNGDPYIESAANGSTFSIEFYGCEGVTACSSMQFYSWYKKAPEYSLEMVNEWNTQKRFLKAYIDGDGDLATSMDVSTLGNPSYDNFADTFDWWTVMTAELFNFLEAKKPAG